MDQVDRRSGGRHAQCRRREDARVQGPGVETSDGKVGEPARPITMMDRHAMDGGQTVVVGKVKDDDVQDQWGVLGFDVMLGSKVEGDALLPFFELSIQLADGIEELTVRLPGRLGRIELLVDLTLDDRKGTHEPEEVDLALATGERNVPNVVRRVLTR